MLKITFTGTRTINTHECTPGFIVFLSHDQIEVLCTFFPTFHNWVNNFVEFAYKFTAELNWYVIAIQDEAYVL